MAAQIPLFELNNSTLLPSVGLGSWIGESGGGGERVLKMCKAAIDAGYRHFDTAESYGNEEQVGKAIKESGVPREEFFVTTKLSNSCHDKVQEAFERSRKALGLDYVDSYLVHWPQASKIDHKTGFLQPEEYPTIIDTWVGMQELLETGKVKSIGVSNFSVKTLNRLLSSQECNVVPAINQVELHPCLPQEELKAFCDEKNILLVAYSPLGQFQPTLHTDATIKSIADKNGATNAQIVLSWTVQRGVAVVPRSEKVERIKANTTLVKLVEEEMNIISNIHKQSGMHKSLLRCHKDGFVLGWTYEQLGWNMKAPGIAL